MVRRSIVALMVLAGISFIIMAWQLSAQPALISSQVTAQNVAAILPANPTLPIKQIVMFNSGVGYFSREGEVDGATKLDMQFPASDINDLLKSMVIDDVHGRVFPMRYDSQEPIEKTLKSFGIDLSTNPSFGELINQARGEKIELTLVNNNGNQPVLVSGVILGMESAQRPVSEHSSAMMTVESLNVMSTEGLRSIPLSQIQRLRFLNPNVENELKRALEIVATGHDSQKKTVRIDLRGQGKRQVKVGYVIENPIWKTSYRVVLTGANKAKLKAWANIENTSDEDWKDIKLTLVAARPISFQMDLYPPILVPRPVVEPEAFASLRPPTYAGPLMGQVGQIPPGNPMAGAPAQNNVGMLFQGGIQGSQIGFQGQFGMQGQLGGNRFSRIGNAVPNDASNITGEGGRRLNYEDFRNRKLNEQNKDGEKKQALEMGNRIAHLDPNLAEAALIADTLGNSTRYTIEEKIDLPRQQSAMLPILDQTIDIERVSIYNERVQPKHPLRGLKIKNNSKQALMQGPITVYDEEQYVGDARILDLQPSEERYISYAIDIGVEVKPTDRTDPAPELTASIQENQLQVQYRLRKTRSYAIRNTTPEDRTIILEQPVETGWKLVVPDKALERTRDMYRFAVTVKAGQSLKFDVSEELPRIDPFAITKNTDWSGFATTLGLDVWTETKRTPEGHFGLRVRGEQLEVNHLDRRTITYFLRNRANIERKVILQHTSPKDRQLIGNVQPVAEEARRYSFELKLKAGETIKQVVQEERSKPAPELFGLQTIEGNPILSDKGTELPMNRFVTELGLELWQERTKQPTQIIKARFEKGVLHLDNQESESIRYTIRNLFPEQRTFQLTHDLRSGWSTNPNLDGWEKISHRLQTPLTVAGNGLIQKTIVEQKVVKTTQNLTALNESLTKQILENKAIPQGIQEAIQKGQTLSQALALTGQREAEVRTQQKELIEEQTRMRTLLEKIPTDAPLHKRYLTKLDETETALEKVQIEITKFAKQAKQQREEFDKFLKELTLE